jgi:hypothetical protein
MLHYHPREQRQIICPMKRWKEIRDHNRPPGLILDRRRRRRRRKKNKKKITINIPLLSSLPPQFHITPIVIVIVDVITLIIIFSI